MKVITVNVNGIRAAARKGFFAWLGRQDFDVCCLQEIKAGHDKLTAAHYPKGRFSYYFPAARPGYSGVGLISKRKPERLIEGFGVVEFDREGRYLEARFDHLAVVSLYVPSGSSGPQRQASKDRFLDAFLPHLEKLRRAPREYLIAGDWNIAHREIDLKNWKSNRKNSGFLPHERAWMDRVFDESGFVDAFRRINPNPDQYTWWSNRGRAWEKNVGWRIDYQVTTPGLGERIVCEHIYKTERFSDHAPLIMSYDRSL